MIDESINKIYEDNKTILIIGMARCGKTTKLLQTIKELEGKRKPPLVIFPAYHKHGVHELSQCDVELFLHHYQPKTPVEEIENVFTKALSEGKDIYIDELMNDGLKEKLIKIYFSQTCVSKSKLFVTLQGIVDVQDKSILKLFDIVLQGKTSRTNVLFEQFKINPLNLNTFIYLGVGEFIAVKTKEDEAELAINEIIEANVGLTLKFCVNPLCLSTTKRANNVVDIVHSAKGIIREKLDGPKGVPFIVFATPEIAGELRNEFADELNKLRDSGMSAEELFTLGTGFGIQAFDIITWEQAGSLSQIIIDNCEKRYCFTQY